MGLASAGDVCRLILFEQLASRESETAPVQYSEEKEIDHVVLRKPECKAAGDKSLPSAN